MSYELVLLAAGQGKRMKVSRNKILLHLKGKPIIVYSLETFLSDPLCTHVILVVQSDEKEIMEKLVKKYFKKAGETITMVVGGQERQDSVYQGIKFLKNSNSYVLVHDGARPFVTKQQINALYEKVRITKAAVLGVPVKDTIKKVIQNRVIETIPRESLWQIQTPQAFLGQDLKEAHEYAQRDKVIATDDSALIEKYQVYSVEMVLGSYENIKLTTPDDMLIGEAIVKRRIK